MEKFEGAKVSKKQRDAGAPKLEHWYGRIGISAVVATLRFTTTKEKSPINPTFTPERRVNLALLSARHMEADPQPPSGIGIGLIGAERYPSASRSLGDNQVASHGYAAH
jgi:hypothetical protein